MTPLRRADPLDDAVFQCRCAPILTIPYALHRVKQVCHPQILASIGQLEFFYDQAPDVMRSCSMALQLLSVAIGSYLSGALVYLVGLNQNSTKNQLSNHQIQAKVQAKSESNHGNASSNTSKQSKSLIGEHKVKKVLPC